MVIRSIKQRSPLAFKAAEATHCAGEQGKYWEMHDRLFANQRELARPDLSKQAQALGLQKLQVNGTPTFFVGVTDPSSSEIKGTRITGAQPYPAFQAAIERLLSSQK